MQEEIGHLLWYIGGFGLAELLFEYLHIHSFRQKLIWYVSLFLLSIYVLQLK